MSVRVAALLTCHNRVAHTLACLESLRRQGGPHDLDIQVFVVDDASTDGTSNEVRRRFPEAVLIEGSGDLFWSGGMRVAFQRSMETNPDHYLWMNDDVVLDPDGLDRLLETHTRVSGHRESRSIVVGSMRDPDTGVLTYGGVRRPSRLRPLKFEVVPPSDEPVQSETMNGNVVLIPREVARTVGNIDQAYQHSMGDYDYGLRARRAGCSVWVAPGTVGTCARNPVIRPGAAPLGQELRRMRSLKGLPPSPWRAFARRWAGPLWPVYYWSPYLRRAGRSSWTRLSGLGRASRSQQSERGMS